MLDHTDRTKNEQIELVKQKNKYLGMLVVTNNAYCRTNAGLYASLLKSNLYADIHLFRYDEKRKEIYILAGETIGITIFSNGTWELDDDTEA